MKHRDFTGLAEDYTNCRPDYAPTALELNFRLCDIHRLKVVFSE
jgi:hypothetical protein